MDDKIKKSNVKGIYYLVSYVSSFRYLTIMHTKTSKIIMAFTSAPISSIRNIIKVSDRILGKCNWGISENELTPNHQKIVDELRMAIPLDRETNRYITKTKVI